MAPITSGWWNITDDECSNVIFRIDLNRKISSFASGNAWSARLTFSSSCHLYHFRRQCLVLPVWAYWWICLMMSSVYLSSFIMVHRNGCVMMWMISLFWFHVIYNSIICRFELSFVAVVSLVIRSVFWCECYWNAEFYTLVLIALNYVIRIVWYRIALLWKRVWRGDWRKLLIMHLWYGISSSIWSVSL